MPGRSTAGSAGREALLCYVLRPPIAQERLEHRPDGLVRILLKKAYSDGTVAVDMDPLSLLCRLATSVPPPRLPSCQGRMRLLAVIKESASITRYLAAVGEATEVPRRSPRRGPPHWKSQVLRRKALGDEEGWGSHGNGADEVA